MQMVTPLFNYFAAACSASGSFLGLPTWYKYLQTKDVDVGTIKQCTIVITDTTDYLLIGFAILDILTRVAGLVAVVFVIVGGVQYLLSQGEPENTKQALHTIINALVGLAIAVLAATAVPFIAKTIGG